MEEQTSSVFFTTFATVIIFNMMGIDKESVGAAVWKELNLWDLFLIFGFILTSLAVSLVTGQFSALSFIGGTLSILCVIFGAKGSMINFLFGFLGSLILGFIMFKSGIYAMAAFYILYNVPMQFIGWRKWTKLRLKPQSGTVRTQWMSWPQRLLMTVSTVLLIAGFYFILSRYTDDVQPLSDSAAVSVAIVTQFVLVFAFIEQWFLWIAMDIVMGIVWIISWKAGTPHAAIQFVLEMFYLINALRGVFLWIRLEKSNGDK